MVSQQDLIDFEPFHSKDVITNSPYCLIYSSFVIVQSIWYWIS